MYMSSVQLQGQYTSLVTCAVTEPLHLNMLSFSCILITLKYIAVFSFTKNFNYCSFSYAILLQMSSKNPILSEIFFFLGNHHFYLVLYLQKLKSQEVALAGEGGRGWAMLKFEIDWHIITIINSNKTNKIPYSVPYYHDNKIILWSDKGYSPPRCNYTCSTDNSLAYIGIDHATCISIFVDLTATVVGKRNSTSVKQIRLSILYEST